MLCFDEIAIRIVVAAFLGALIGLERDLHGRSAGLRTHILVTIGAAAFMIISIKVSLSVGGAVSDPGRIAAQVVTGIGFLGAGVILKDGASVRGLTTAACLWSSAAVGMAAGGGYFFIAGTVTLIALFGLVILKYFENLYQSDSYGILSVSTSLKAQPDDILSMVKRKHVTVINYDMERDYITNSATLKFNIRINHKIADKEVKEIIKSLDSSELTLKQLEWKQS